MRVEWTPEHVEIVKSMYPTSTYEEIAALIPNLSYRSLQTKARRLGVVKCEEYRLAIVDRAVANSVKARRGKPTWNAKEHPILTCEYCGKEFTVKSYRGEKAKYCSRKCNGAALKGAFTGEKNTRFNSVECICPICGKSYFVKAGSLKNGRGKFCSKQCHIQDQINKPCPLPIPPRKRINLICKFCGKEFEIVPSLNVNDRRKYCSRKCASYAINNILNAHNTPTSIEKAIDEALTELEEPHEAEVKIGFWRVDFYLPNRHLVIECDGKYWHSKPEAIIRDKQKNTWLKNHGYNLLRLGEDAIKANAFQCVVDGLAQFGINSPAI